MVQTGVQRTFGPRLRSFLAAALSNRVKAAGAGAAVTIALQSSTATGLMLTAFSAGGLVELAPALSVMLGANIGTTVVVQLLSFDVVALAPILVLAGVVLFRRAQEATKDFGRVLIGLGLMLTALHQFLALLGPVVADSRALSGARAKLERYAVHLAETHARQAPVMLALAGAATADPDAAAIWRKNLTERRHGMAMFAADLAVSGELRPEHTVETAADVLWLAMDFRNWDWLVRERGWSPERFRRWYVDTVAAAILSP